MVITHGFRKQPKQLKYGEGLFQKARLVFHFLLFKTCLIPFQVGAHIDRFYPGMMYPYVPYHFEAVFSRHLDIGKNDVGFELEEDLIPLLAIRGCLHTDAHPLYHFLYEIG